MQRVGDHEQARGPRGQAFACVREELEERVEGQELDAGAREDLLPRHDPEHLVHGVRRPRVAVADGRLDQGAGGVEQRIVHGPRVHTEAADALARLGGGGAGRLQALGDPVEEEIEVPAQVAVPLGGAVAEAVDLAQLHATGAEAAEHGATAARAEVDGDAQGGAVGHGVTIG